MPKELKYNPYIKNISDLQYDGGESESESVDDQKAKML